MAKQYHYVVMFDEERKEWSIEWDTTDVMLEQVEGTVFDTETTEWTTSSDTEDIEQGYRDTSDVLAELLNSYNVQLHEDDENLEILLHDAELEEED